MLPFRHNHPNFWRFQERFTQCFVVYDLPVSYTKDNCPFCLLPKEEILYSSDLVISFHDRFPVSPGHTLIITKRHIPSFFEASEEERKAIDVALQEMKVFLDEKFLPDGYNIGVNCGETAGQSVPHLHVHLIPRYKGDMQNPKGGVRGVIPSKQSY